ncbi:type II secretion system F family protein [bacterium]|nr:type II secretion system F family protein [bacterium]
MILFLLAAISVCVSSLFIGIAVDARLSGKTREQAIQNIIDGEQVQYLHFLELTKPFSERVVDPFLRRIGDSVRKITPDEIINSIQDKIYKSGVPTRPIVVVAWQIGLAVFVPAITAGFGFLKIAGLFPGVLFLLAFGIIGYSIPYLILMSKIYRRAAEIGRALPDALDILTVSVEAGLGFDAAIAKTVEKTKGPLSDEFALALYEIRLGKSRHDAFTNMAKRTEAREVIQFISALNQADKLGVGITTLLKVQSDQLRHSRRQKAEELAYKAPVKISIVLVLFIFPALMIVLLGPALMKILEVFGHG